MYSYSVQQQNPLGFPPGLIPHPQIPHPHPPPAGAAAPPPPQPVPQQQQHVKNISDIKAPPSGSKEKEMQKRADALAGKISATVTITTNSQKEKNGFLPSAAVPPPPPVAVQQQPKQKTPKPQQLILAPPAVHQPNANIIPLASGGLVIPSIPSSSQLATITPIYSQPKLRDYRKPKKPATKNPIPDEISVTAVIGPQKQKANYQEPASVSCYPLPSKQAKRSGNLEGEPAAKRAKSDNKFLFPKGLTVTEIAGGKKDSIPVLHIPDDDILPSMRPHMPHLAPQVAAPLQQHPGMPNGLLSVTSLQSHQSQKRMMLKDTDKKPATITISMAESAVSACVQPAPTFKPVRANKGGKGSKGASPGSSRSSSRNSSLSPRERSGSMSKSISPKSLENRQQSRHQSTPNGSKKRSPVPNGPLIPWSKRNNGVLKTCNGWQWEGEGRIQKVYLNVSFSYLNRAHFPGKNDYCIFFRKTERRFADISSLLRFNEAYRRGRRQTQRLHRVGIRTPQARPSFHCQSDLLVGKS